MVDEEEDDLLCNKDESRGYSHKKHTAGLFVGCCLHAVVYGFHMMVQPEGRKDLMKVLYERFPKEVLDLLCVVFDFNCQAAEYMLNRDPETFSDIRLLIDQFHAMSHKCADVFKMQSFAEFQELVTTSSESANLFIQRMHSQAPFMKQETFMLLCQTILGVRNWLFCKDLELKKQKHQ